jgi:hypothetical protein
MSFPNYEANGCRYGHNNWINADHLALIAIMYFISYVREVGAERIERFQIPHVYITAKSSGTRNAADCKCLKGPAGREEEVAGAAGD